ncbi:MAG TPA: hypothetical protein VMT20_00325 [Terriglobia bacterium]|nr:hypothetical protein [Terriglobia bacterium]
MQIQQPQRDRAAQLIARPLALCRRAWSAIARRAQIVLQRALSRKPRLAPEHLPVIGANLRAKVTPMPKQPAAGRSNPVAVGDHVLRLVKPGHGEFGGALRKGEVATDIAPRLASPPQPDTAPGQTPGTPNAENRGRS